MNAFFLGVVYALDCGSVMKELPLCVVCSAQVFHHCEAWTRSLLPKARLLESTLEQVLAGALGAGLPQWMNSSPGRFEIKWQF